jgi:perosamine synthetase
MKVPVNAPVITAESKKYVAEAMDSGWVSSAGPFIDKFEQEFAAYVGVKHGISVSSGTAALHIALLALGIGEGDEVIVPDFTMIASVFAILYTGATPVFVDVDPETFCIDPDKVSAAITKRTKAIMPVHIYGHPADMDRLQKIADKYGIPLVEDAAEAHGALCKGRKCGSMGQINCFSFYANKIITTGEGGMIVTDDDALAESARRLKDLAHIPGKRFTHDAIGYNYRMTNLQAALGLGQLAHIDEFLAHKEWMAAEYGKRLKNVPGIRLPFTKPNAKNVYWMYAIVLDEEFPSSRADFRKRLLDKGVDTRDFFTSSARQPIIEELLGPSKGFPVSEWIAARGLYLPSGLALTQEELNYVCDQVESVVHG